MKHIRKGKLIVCAICGKEFTHTKNLKIHIIKAPKVKELEAKLIDPELVLAESSKKHKPKNNMTDLEEIK